MDTKQLYEKDNSQYKEVYPITDVLSIIDKESGKTLKELLNIYNHLKLTWQGTVAETRKTVPVVLRHNGLYITYNNGASVVTEYYIGSNLNAISDTLWVNDSYWQNTSQAANLADNEDLVDKNGKLSFADRKYAPSIFSGMGRIILRKNLIDVGGTVYNVLTQDMFTQSNTIYEIRYDFDLQGAEITIPEGCVLEFDGGSLSNGIIIGNNTVMYGVCIVTEITFFGTFICESIYSKDFSYSDDTELFRNISVLCNSDYTTNVYFSDREYNVSITEINGCVFNIPSKTNIYLSGTIRLLPNNLTHFHIIRINNAKKVRVIGDATIVGDAVGHLYEHNPDGSLVSTYEWGHNLKIVGSEDVLIEGITSVDAVGDSIGIDSSDFGVPSRNILIKGCTLKRSRRQGISIEGVDGVVVYGCTIEDIGKGEGGRTNPGAGIDVEPWRTSEIDGEVVNEYCRNVTIDNCIIRNCYGGAISSARYIENITVKHSNLDVVNSFHYDSSGSIEYYNCVIANATVHLGEVNMTASKIGRLCYNKGVKSNINNCEIDYSLCPTYIMESEYLSVIILSDKTPGAPYDIHISNCLIDAGPYNLARTKASSLNPNSDTRIINCSIKVDGDAETGTFDMYNNVIECHRLSIKSALGRTYSVVGNTILINDECESSAKSAIMFRKPLQDFSGYLVDFSDNYVVNKVKEGYTHIVFPYENERLNFSSYKLKWRNNSFDNAFPTAGESSSYNLRTQVELGNWETLLFTQTWRHNYNYYGFTDPTDVYTGSPFYNINEKQFKIWNGTAWVDAIGNNSLAIHKGTSAERPTGINDGYAYYDTSLKKMIYWATTHWKEEDGVLAGTKRQGTFYNKPSVANHLIYIGFAYFCTDRQTTEGAVDGIMIYHKGEDVWVDALGRVVK